jgi:predicted nucleic acid-binding Zn ribbon protein
MTGSLKHCPNCGSQVTGHPNKKFCNSTCKDRFHNETNPRGRFAHLKISKEEAAIRDAEEMHREAMDAQEASESPGGFFG